MDAKQFKKPVAYTIGLAAFIGLISLCQHVHIEAPDRVILGNFIEWFGILFSIMLALVVVEVWTKYNTVESLVDKEADALVSLLRFARFLENPQLFAKLAQAIYEYCQHFARSSKLDPNQVVNHIEKMEPIFAGILEAAKTGKLPFAVNEMIRCFDEASDARGDREALAKQRIPGVLWFMMVFNSMIWLLGFFWFSFQDVNVYVAAFMLLSTTFSVVGLLVIADDIDNPVSGIWKIKYDSFASACKETEHMQNLLQA